MLQTYIVALSRFQTLANITLQSGITPGVDGLSGDPLQLYLRSQAGNRVSQSINESHRIFAGLEGEAYGWDINGGVTYAKGEASDSFVSGYLNRNKLQEGLNDGTINPFRSSATLTFGTH